jgi:hypothetical protein
MRPNWGERRYEQWQRQGFARQVTNIDTHNSYPILQQSAEWEGAARRRKDAQDAALWTGLCWAFVVLGLLTFAGWCVWIVIPWCWQNMVWLWNVGTDDQPWRDAARWSILTAAIMVVFCSAMMVREWWKKRN